MPVGREVRSYEPKLPIENDLVTLILVRPIKGVKPDGVRFACSLSEKASVLHSCQSNDKLLAAWTGKTATHIFEVPWKIVKELRLGKVFKPHAE